MTITPSTGVFSGNAYGENIGWITFSDTSPVAYQVQTSTDVDGDGVLADADNCPDNTADDAWPWDITNDTIIDGSDVVLLAPPNFGEICT